MVNEIKTSKKHKLFKKQQAIDPVTGEVNDILMIASPKEVDKDFTKVFHAFTEALLEDDKIAGKSIRLLFWIMKQLEMDRLEFYMHPDDVAKELNVTRVTIYNWIKTLNESGIIRKIRPNLYQINPACVFKGTGHNLLQEFNKGDTDEE